jgi:hypothetical protein
MYTKLKKIEVFEYNEENPLISSTIRLSVYFDFQNDNYHIKFPKDIDRGKFLGVLQKFYDSIEKGKH